MPTRYFRFPDDQLVENYNRPNYQLKLTMKKITSTILLATSLGLASQASATIVFQGGSIHSGGNWFDTDNGNATGLPGSGETATIAVDGIIVNGTTNFGTATVNHTAGTLTSNASNINLNFNGAGGTYNLQGGTLVLRGLQANNATINLESGLVRLGTTTDTGIGFGVNNNGTLNISGSVDIESDRAITNQFDTGTFDFASDWTGSFTVVGFENAGGFQNLVQEFGASVDGTEVTDANFGDFFELSTDGLTLTAVPEPSSAALLGLGGLALIMRRRK